MKRIIIYLGIFVVFAVFLIFEISFIHAGRIVTIENEEKVAQEAYINKDQPTAIYIKGNPEPLLRIEDLPKEFPAHIQHPEGARFPDTRFNLAFLSPDAKRIAFSCGAVHNWVGVYELESKKVHVFTWLFDTHVKQILWSPNSKYFAYTYVPPRGDNIVSITGFRERTSEPYLTMRWSSIEDEHIYSGLEMPVCILIEHLDWSKDSKTMSFEIHKCKIEGLKLIKIEEAPVDTITIKVTKEEAREDPLEVQLAEKAFWEHRLSDNEQMIVDLFNIQRAAREIDTFEVNVKLSKAIKDEAENIVDLESDADSIEKKLFDFISHFGDKAFFVKGTSKEALLDNIRLNEKLQREILHPDNIMLSLCCVEDTLRDFLYLLLYTSKYNISYGPCTSTVSGFDGGPISNTDEINGKTNAKYLKYNFYEGTVFPFYYKGEKMVTKELETGEDGSFSIALGFSGYGYERRRLAIFVRNNPEEPYTLVDFFPVWGGIKR